MPDKLSNIIFHSISDGVFTVDRGCIITSFNRAAENITGFKAEETIGKHCFDVFRTEICHQSCALKDTLKTAQAVENARVTIITRNEQEVPISVTTTLLRDENDSVIGAVEFFRDISELEQLRESLGLSRGLNDIITASPKMHEITRLLPDVAEAECNVLINGPSGSGKELFAQIIHSLSPRRYGPYIRLNCAALPPQLLESELFGYEKGAFTDAKRNKPGQFSLANGGTLLLDEIAEMDVSLQVKLLRVLNNGEYQPLGSTKTLHTDARIIAATNADLAGCIENGSFREDLFYRINVVSIDIPPLRERPEDIPLLASHFIRVLSGRKRKPIQGISPAALSMLCKYRFSGNVRELENAIEHAFVMCHGDTIEVEHLPIQVVHAAETTNGFGGDDKTEKLVLQEALRRFHGNRSRAATELGMHRSTLWRKIKCYGLG